MRLPLLQNDNNLIPWGNELVRVLEVAVNTMQRSKQTLGGIIELPSYTVATVPNVEPAGQMIYVSNETGGAVPAFSDGVNWRRVTDRAIVS